MTTGSTRLVGVMGWPVRHSLSPAMHNAAFAALGLDWAYLPLSVPPDRLRAAVAGLRALGFSGANVTAPHKQAVMRRLDHVTPLARTVGAVNTIIVGEDGSLTGDTTDGYGFLRDLVEHGVELPGKALVIGSAGAARSIVHALAGAGASVIVTARDEAKAQDLCAALGRSLPQASARLAVAPFHSGLATVAQDAELIVNATSLGLQAGDPLPWHEEARFRPGQVAYDLVYHRETEFLKLAAAQGARAIGGLGMLVHQGARSFELWTGLVAPVGVMMAAVQEVAGSRGSS